MTVCRGGQRLALAVVLGALLATGCTTTDSDRSMSPRRADKRFVVSPVAAEPHLLGLKWNWRQRGTLEFAGDSRGGSTFFQVEWCDIEAEEGSRDWGRVDEVVTTVQAMRYELLLKIRTGSCWATGGASAPRAAAAGPGAENVGKRPSSLPADMSSYRDFVHDLVSRYAQRGVHRFAIENEIDTENLWQGTGADYETLVEEAAEVVREADPTAIVLDAGLSSSAYGAVIAADLLDRGREDEAVRLYSDYYERRIEGDASRFPAVDDVQELREVVESDKGRRVTAAAEAITSLHQRGIVDEYQLHYYEPWQLAATVVEWVRRRLPPGTAIAAWEVGLAWPGESYEEEQHAHETTRLMVTLLAAGVERTVYLPLAYTPRQGREQVFRGLVQADGTELPAAEAYRALAQATEGARAVAPVAVEGLLGAAFEVPRGTRTVLWSETGGTVVVRPRAADLSDADGSSSPTHVGQITIGSDPVITAWALPAAEVMARLEDSVPD